MSGERKYGTRPVADWAQGTFPRAVTTTTVGYSESSGTVLWESHSYRDMALLDEPYAITRRGAAGSFAEAIEQAHEGLMVRPRLGLRARLRALLTGRVR